MNSTNSVDIEVPITLETNTTFNGTGTGTVTLGGAVTGAGQLIKGTVGGGSISPNTMILTNTGNNYFAGTIIGGGVMIFGVGAYPTTSNILVNSPAVVWFQDGTIPAVLSRSSDGGFAVGAAFANTSYDFNAAGLRDLYLNAAESLTYGGVFTPGTNSYNFGALSGATLTITNDLADVGALPTSLNVGPGVGTVALLGNNTFTSNTLIKLGGALYITNDNALGAPNRSVTLSSGGFLEITNNITLNGRTVTANNTGGITVDGVSTLTITNPVGGPGVITKAGDGTLDLQATNTVAGITINAGLVIAHGDIALSNAVITMNVPNTATTGFTNDSTATSWTYGGLGGTNQLALTNSVGGQITTLTLGNVSGVSGVYSGSLYGLTSLIKNGNNVQVLNGSNTSVAGETVTINGGVLQFGTNSSIGGTGANITLNNGATAADGSPIDQTFIDRIAPGSIGVVALAVTNSANNLTFASANLANVSLGVVAGDNRIYRGTLTQNGTTYRLGGGGGTLTVPNTNALTGANSLLIQGIGGFGGTVILGSSNNYTRGTIVTNAALTLQNGTAAGFSLNSTVTVNNATLNVVNPIGNTMNFLGVSFVNLSGGNHSLAAIIGNGQVTINSGNNQFTLPGATQPFSGVLIVTNGTVRMTGGGNMPSTTFVFMGGAGYNQKTGGGDMSFGAVASSFTNSYVIGRTDGGLTTRNQVYTIGGVNTNVTFAGLIQQGTITGQQLGILKTNNNEWTLTGNTLLSGPLAFAGGMNIAGGTIAVGPYATSTNYSLANSGTIAQRRPNTWTVNGALVFTNGAASGETFAIGALSGTNGLNLVDAADGVTPITLFINSASGIDTTNSGNITGGGKIVKQGLGVLTLSGTNTYTGGTTIEQGVLGIGTSNTFPITGTLAISNGASVGLFFTGIQGAINNLSPSTAGGVAISAGSANENVNFATAGITNAWLVAAQSMTYGGVYTPFTNSYRLGANAGAMFVYTNILTELGGLPTTLRIGDFGGGTVALFAKLGIVTNGSVITTNQLLIVTNSYSGGTFVNGSAGWSTLYIASDFNLGASASLVLSNAILRTTNSFTLNNRPISAPGAIFEFNVDPFSTLTLTNAITGSGQLQKWGDGTLVLVTNDAATGGILIGGGVLAYVNSNNVPQNLSIDDRSPAAIQFLFPNGSGLLLSAFSNTPTATGGYAINAALAAQNLNFGPTPGANAPNLSLVAEGTNPVFYAGTFVPYTVFSTPNRENYNLGAMTGATLWFTNNIPNPNTFVYIGGFQGGYPGTVVLSGNNSYATNPVGGATTTIMSPATLKITSSTSIGGPGDGISRSPGGLAFSNGFATLQVTNNVDFTSHAVFMDGGNAQINVDAGSMLTIPTKITLTQNGTLTKGGAGVLWLTGTSVTTDGRFLFDINFNGGVVRADPDVAVFTGGTWKPTVTNSSHTLSGGVWEFTVGGNPLSNALIGVITRRGTNLFGVRIDGGVSGFSAYGNDLALSIRNGTTELLGTVSTNSWGASFNPSTLVLNEITATANLSWSNSIDLNNAGSNLTTRTIAVNATNPWTSTILGQIMNIPNSSTYSNGIFTDTAFAGLTKTGVGVLRFNTNETYNGPTTVNLGTLALIGNGSLTNSLAIIVGNSTNGTGYFDASAVGGITIGSATNQTLGGGPGVVFGNVTIANGSILAPGDTGGTTNYLYYTNGLVPPLTNSMAGYNVLNSRIGTLTLSNNLTLNNGSVLNYDLGTNSDLTVVSNNVTLGGTSTLNIRNSTQFAFQTNYLLMTYGGILSGGTLTIGSTPTNAQYTGITYGVDTSTVPGQVILNLGVPANVAGLTYSTNGQAAFAAKFDDTTSTGVISNYFITFGDGNYTNMTGSTTNLVYTYASCVGSPFTVTLAVIGSGGSNTMSISVTPSGCGGVLPDPYAQWKTLYGLGAFGDNSDPLGKGMSLTNQFLAGLNPTNAASVFRVIAIARQAGTNTVTWKTSGGDPLVAAFGPTIITNIVQGSVGSALGYSNNFGDISGPLTIGTPSSGDTTTNFPDSVAGSATNKYYRIRLAP